MISCGLFLSSFFGALQGLTDQELYKETLQIAKELRMQDKMDTKVKNLSGGTKRKTNMAMALIGKCHRKTPQLYENLKTIRSCFKKFLLICLFVVVFVVSFRQCAKIMTVSVIFHMSNN